MGSVEPELSKADQREREAASAAAGTLREIDLGTYDRQGQEDRPDRWLRV